MRRNRIIWICLWILSIIGISKWGGSISYGIFTMLTLIPLISVIYIVIVYTSFRIYQNNNRKFMIVNESVPFYLTLVNEFYIPFVCVRVKFFSSFSSLSGLDDGTEYELFPRTDVTRETSLVCKYRGEYEVGISRVEIQDYLRLFKFSFRNRETLRVVVKPRIVYLDALNGIDINNILQDSKINASEVDVTSREYVPGDDPRLINWGQLARTGSLMVRNRIGQEQQKITILMDTERYSNNNLEYIPVENRILEIVLAIAAYFSNKNISVAEYHYRDNSLMINVAENGGLGIFYENISQVSFAEANEQRLLFADVSKRPEVMESAFIFMIIASWNEYTYSILERLERDNKKTLIYYVSSGAEELPDLSSYNNIDAIKISPFAKLEEVML